ncbi:MAG: lasso peptide biosynthesis B2 protein, partial [Anaerolineae bacterium]|nr:lasso peptide biosynthesis B2 protein [Anaerolineae bacterium]
REWGSETTPLSVERIADLVAIAARHHLYQVSCLTRALASQRMLAVQGIWVDLRIGVCREHARLRAHAWIEYHGEPVGESADVGTVFGPLGRAGEFALAPDDLVKSY